MLQKTEGKKSRCANIGLRQRLIVALLVPLISILLLSSLFDYRLARETTDSAHDQSLADDVFDIEAHIREHEPAPTFDLTSESEAMLRSNEPDKLYFSIRNADGQLLAGDADIPLIPIPATREISFVDGRFRDVPVRVALHRVKGADSDILVTVMETTERRKRVLQRVLTAMLLPNLAVFFATLLAVLFGVRRGLLPLETVEQEIAARSPNDLREIDLTTTPREIQPTLRRLNELFSLLREASAAQNRFIADAAHQLRTPLAGLQTQLDLAVGEGAFSSNQGRLQNIEEGMQRLGRLLGQLLSYARAEASAPLGSQPETVALDQVAEKSASMFIDAALAKDLDLGFDLSPATVPGTPWLLQEALANLVDNAIRYSPHGGVITVRCGLSDGKSFLEVEDDGPGIADEHLTHVFERFWRVPGSPANGCGLGLPIVKEIAEFHGGTVQLLHRESAGLRVRLEFPA